MNHGCVATARGVFHSAHSRLAQPVTASMESSTMKKKTCRKGIKGIG